MKFLSTSPKQTLNFAKKFSKNLIGGEIIGLTGNLGAGKTVFTKGLALGLGIKKNIVSPTFVLVKVYPVKKHRTIRTLFHIDAYRLESADDLMTIGVSEYFKQPDAVTIIEWADKIKKNLPKKARSIEIKQTDKNIREILVKK